ncbi:MAG: caspase family protein [Fimbriimonadaceae bacterium]
MHRPLLALILAFLLVAFGAAQNWRSAYETGLSFAKEGRWGDARASFKTAATDRAKDQSGPTALPGPATELRQWRDGAPYSPNFLAAYAQYRMALESSGDEMAAGLRVAGAEFEALIAEGQISREAAYFGIQSYSRLADSAGRQRIENAVMSSGSKTVWQVDRAPIAPEEKAEIDRTFSGGSNTVKAGGGGGVVTKPPAGGGTGAGAPILSTVVGRVPVIPNKYALIIANAESRMPDGAVPFAIEDANVVKDALIQNGGYAEQNIVVIANATAAQMLSAAQALGEKVVSDVDTVLIYFAGAGANIDGKDYLAGIDSQMSTEAGTMLAKMDLFMPFISKGANIFAFFESGRPMRNGTCFGGEIPMFGKTAQIFATIRGEQVQSSVREGKAIGVFADSFAAVLQELKSNRVPVLEFGWQVFYRMRRGTTGTLGGGRSQIPTLPLLSNMASNAGF